MLVVERRGVGDVSSATIWDNELAATTSRKPAWDSNVLSGNYTILGDVKGNPTCSSWLNRLHVTDDADGCEGGRKESSHVQN